MYSLLENKRFKCSAEVSKRKSEGGQVEPAKFRRTCPPAISVRGDVPEMWITTGICEGCVLEFLPAVHILDVNSRILRRTPYPDALSVATQITRDYSFWGVLKSTVVV